MTRAFNSYAVVSIISIIFYNWSYFGHDLLTSSCLFLFWIWRILCSLFGIIYTNVSLHDFLSSACQVYWKRFWCYLSMYVFFFKCRLSTDIVGCWAYHSNESIICWSRVYLLIGFYPKVYFKMGFLPQFFRFFII